MNSVAGLEAIPLDYPASFIDFFALASWTNLDPEPPKLTMFDLTRREHFM